MRPARAWAKTCRISRLQLWLGGVQAPVIYQGRSGCCIGEDQIVFTVPNNVPTGCAVPLSIQIGNEISNNTLMPVAATRKPQLHSHQCRLRVGKHRAGDPRRDRYHGLCQDVPLFGRQRQVRGRRESPVL